MKSKSFWFDQSGQLSMEGVISGIIAAIVYVLTAAYVFQPIFSALQPTLENTGNTYGAIASSIIMIAVYIITPLGIIVTIVSLMRPKVEYVQ